MSVRSLPLGMNKRNATLSAPLRMKDILIGTCTPEDFAVGAVSCEREFFLAFQLDKATQCRLILLLFCVKNTTVWSIERQFSDQTHDVQ